MPENVKKFLVEYRKFKVIFSGSLVTCLEKIVVEICIFFLPLINLNLSYSSKTGKGTSNFISDSCILDLSSQAASGHVMDVMPLRISNDK